MTTDISYFPLFSRLLFVALTLFCWWWTFSLIRNRRLELRYAFVWILGSGFLLAVSIVPKAFILFSQTLGFKYPSNAFLLGCLSFMFLVTSLLTTLVGTLKKDLKNLAQHVALEEHSRAARQDQNISK